MSNNSKENNGVTLMALAKGKEVKEVSFKNFIGVAAVKVVAVNPTKEQFEKMTGRTLDKETVYVTENDGVKNARIDFIIVKEATPESEIEFTLRMPFFVRDGKMVSQAGKTKVIDVYGRTAWVTEEELAAGAIPIYSNGMPANISKGYRPCYSGEEELTNFLRTLLGIPKVEKWENGKVVGLIDNPAEAETRLDHISDFFKGNFKEIQEAITLWPNNKIKVLMGVRTNADNKQYQAFFMQRFMSPNSTNYDYLVKAVESEKAAGRYADTEFEICELKEYSQQPTDFTQPENGGEVEDPWNK